MESKSLLMMTAMYRTVKTCYCVHDNSKTLFINFTRMKKIKISNNSCNYKIALTTSLKIIHSDYKGI